MITCRRKVCADAFDHSGFSIQSYTPLHRESPIPPVLRNRLAKKAFSALLFVGAILVPAAGEAYESAEPDPHFYVRSQTFVDAYQLRRLDGGVTATRRAVQRVDLVGAGEGVIAVFGASYGFDEGLRSTPRQDEVLERQLQPVLHRASVRWNQGRALQLTFGRHDLVRSGLGLARIDGISANLNAGAFHFHVAAGIRPDDALVRFDDASYQPNTSRDVRNEFGDHTSLVQAHVRYSVREGALSLGVRRERSIDGDYREGTRFSLGARAGESNAASLAGRLQVLAETGALERYDLSGRWANDRIALQAVARGNAAIFPVESIFSVFPISSYDQQALRLTHSRNLEASTELFTRSSGAVGGARADRLRTGGAALSLSDRHPSGSFWRATARYGHGARRTEFRAVGLWTLAPRRGPRWQTTCSFSRRTSEFTGLETERIATFARLGAHWPVDDWATLSISADSGWDTRNRASVRVFASADVSLPGGPS